MFTQTLLVAAVAGLASSFPLATRQEEIDPRRFGLISIRSGSEVHLAAVQASNNAFWLYKSTVSYCPAQIAESCPAGNETVFHYGSDFNTLGLDVAVPGGQQIYYTPSGYLGYTQPHSGQMPKGANVTGFTFTPPASEGTLGQLGLADPTLGFQACPFQVENSTITNTTSLIYQISVTNVTKEPEEKDANCYGIALGTVTDTSDEPGAWEYV